MTDGVNPLETLGVPKALVARERELGNLDVIFDIAKGYYRVLAKKYHTDTGHDDESLMSEFAQAFNDLEDPVGLEFYVDDYLDTATTTKARSVLASRNAAQAQGAILSALAAVNTISPSRKLGVEGSSSVLVWGAPDLPNATFDYIIEYVDGEIRVFFTNSREVSVNVYGKPRYTKGQWKDKYLAGDSRPKTVTFENLVLLEEVTVLGSIDYQLETTRPKSFRASKQSATLESVQLQRQPNWTRPENAWFLEKLEPYVDDRCVVLVRSDGNVCLCGPVGAAAVMK